MIIGYSRAGAAAPSVVPPAVPWQMPLSIPVERPIKRLMPNLFVRDDGGWMSAAVVIPVSPSALTGLIGWWDTSVTASLTGAGGGFVSAIADQSGGGNNMTFATTTTTYSATGFNTSYPALIFEVATRAGYYTCANFPMGTGATLTAWYVGQLIDNGNAFLTHGRPMAYAAPGQNDFDNANSWAIDRPSLNSQIEFARNNTTSTGSVTLTSPHRVIVTVDALGAETTYVNGVATAGTTVAGNWLSAGTMYLGRSPSTLLGYWNGPIAEWGVATGFSNSTVVAGLDLHLKTKWGM